MPRKWVEPREQKKRGEKVWVVTTPKELISANRSKRRFFTFEDKDAAQSYADDLNDTRAGSIKWFLALPAETQSAIHTALETMKGRESDMPKAAELYMQTQIVSKPVSECVELCLKSRKDMDVRASTYASLKSTLMRFAKSLGARSINSITAEDVESWLDSCTVSQGKRKGQKIGKPTRRGYVTDLRTLFNFARAKTRRYCLENPALDVVRPGHEDMPRGILTVAQCKTLLAWVRKNDPGMMRYVCLTLFGGIRPDEARWITDEHFKGREIVIEGDTAKGRKRRVVEINTTLRAWLKACPPPKLKNWDRREKKLHAVIQPWPHDALRHSFCSYRLMIVGVQKAAREAGHSEQTMLTHYQALVTTAEARKFWALRPGENK
jgi:integrase